MTAELDHAASFSSFDHVAVDVIADNSILGAIVRRARRYADHRFQLAAVRGGQRGAGRHQVYVGRGVFRKGTQVALERNGALRGRDFAEIAARRHARETPAAAVLGPTTNRRTESKGDDLGEHTNAAMRHGVAARAGL